MSIEGMQTIGLDGEQRVDHALRATFVPVFNAVSPYLDDAGNWLSNIHEVQAHQVLADQFPDVTGMRQFAVLARIANVRASGRMPA